MKYKIGVSTNCECGVTIQETLHNIKSAGFENIMLSEKSGDLESSLKAIRTIGIQVPYVHLAYKMPFGKNVNDLWTNGEANRALIADLIKRLELCKKSGVEVAVMHTTNYPAGRDRSSWSISQGIKSMKKIINAAREIGIVIAVENQSPTDCKYMRYILDAIDSPYLGLCYDCGHHYLLTSTDDILGEYGSRLVALHLHDNFMDAVNFETWERDLHLLPFDGKINFDKIMRALAAWNYNGIIMLELHKQVDGNDLYKKMSPVEFLKEAKKRGENLSGMLEKHKQKY